MEGSARFARYGLAIASFFVGISVAQAVTPYERVVTKLQQVQAANPDITTSISLGTNDQGVEIVGLRIGQNAGASDPANFLVVGAHHGNEQLSTDVALRFLERQVALYAARDPGTVDVAYHIFPVLNVSGYNAGRREESSRLGGTMDPNRDYPDPCATDQPFRLNSTRLLGNYLTTANIVAATTIHGYIGTFTYPWGTYTSESHTLDHAEFHNLGTVAIAANGYQTGTHGDLIYPTVGAFEDWAYYELGVWVTLLEIKSRPDLNKDANALERFFAAAPRVRSDRHGHLGRCTQPEGPVRGRP